MDLKEYIVELISKNFSLNGLNYDVKLAGEMYDEIIEETKGLDIVETIKNKDAKGHRKCFFTYIKHGKKVVILNNTL